MVYAAPLYTPHLATFPCRSILPPSARASQSFKGKKPFLVLIVQAPHAGESLPWSQGIATRSKPCFGAIGGVMRW
jgi:hypothetical protein